MFIGDSVMRQRYRAIKHLLLNKPIAFIQDGSQSYDDNDSSTRVQFINKNLGTEWLSFVHGWSNTFQKLTKPDFVMVGFGFWEIMTANTRGMNAVSDYYLEKYQQNVAQISKQLEIHRNESDIIWALPGPVNYSCFDLKRVPHGHDIHWKASLTRYKERFPNGSETPIELYNDIAERVLDNTNLTVSKVFYPIGKEFEDRTQGQDGIHVGVGGMKIIQQIIANYLCNSVMKYEDGTCCRERNP